MTLWRLITSPLDLTQGNRVVLSAKTVTEIPSMHDWSTILNLRVKSAKTIEMTKSSTIDLGIKSETSQWTWQQKISQRIMLHAKSYKRGDLRNSGEAKQSPPHTHTHNKGMFGTPLLNFRALKDLEHFSSLLNSKVLMWGGLEFRAHFKPSVWSFSSKVYRRESKQALDKQHFEQRTNPNQHYSVNHFKYILL